jgi:hypothetical protein
VTDARPDATFQVPFPDDAREAPALAGGTAEQLERWLAAELLRHREFGRAVLTMEVRIRRSPVRRTSRRTA